VLLHGVKVHADGQTDRHDEASSSFSQFLRKRVKRESYVYGAVRHLDS